MSNVFPFPHLLGVADLSVAHVETILQRADRFADMNAAGDAPERSLKDKTLINLFFESSTRTQASFELAAKRLGATVMNMSVKTSSMSKGETLVDTATTLNAMLPDILVSRHPDSGAVALLAEKVRCSVVNAGDGWHEHPTQALLDALTIRRAFRARRGAGSDAAALQGLTIAICGDVMHSRVARSNIFLHRLLGNRVRVVAPPTLTPACLAELDVEVFTEMAAGVDGADAVMMLRLQRERMDGAFIPSLREYFHHFGLTRELLANAAPDALVMHPGPMNRGVEIDSELADDAERSVIATQVEMGVAVRMAVLELVAANPAPEPRKRPPAPAPDGMRRFIAEARARRPRLQAFLGARLIDPEIGLDAPGALIISDDEVVEAAPGLTSEAAPADAERVDCAGAILGPGLVDMRVFIGEPGARHLESFGSGGEAAVAGGVTTIVTQPDASPPVDDPALLDFIAQRVREERQEHAMPRVLTMAAMTRGLEGRVMAEYDLLLKSGAVALSEGAKSVADSLVFRRCLSYAASLGALVCHQPMDPHLAVGACATESVFATKLGLPSAPASAETIGLARDLALAAAEGARLHAAQISTAGGVEAIRRAKAEGVDVSAAASAPHFSFSEEDVAGYRTFFKVDPPLRSRADRAAVIAALADGTIDCIVSSHTPWNEEAKRLPYAQAAAGAVGLETLLSASLELARSGALSLTQLFAALALNPANRLGLPTGRLRRGAPADLVVFDFEAERVLDRRRLRSKSKNSPFDRAVLRGAVLRTVVGGRTVFLAEPPPEGAGAAS